MKNMRAVHELNEKELRLYGAKLVENPEISWHADYSHSPYIYVGGLHYDLTEGDVLTVFSQWVYLKILYYVPDPSIMKVWKSYWS